MWFINKATGMKFFITDKEQIIKMSENSDYEKIDEPENENVSRETISDEEMKNKRKFKR